MSQAVQILIASSDEAFVCSFDVAACAAGFRVAIATDGFEALTTLELGETDLLLIDGGNSHLTSGLTGIAGDELSHMWRQIEGSGNHLIIGYVSSRCVVSDDKNIDSAGTAVKIDSRGKRSRFFDDPNYVVVNRGVDLHFWGDEKPGTIVSRLAIEFETRRRVTETAIEDNSDSSVVRLFGRERSGD